MSDESGFHDDEPTEREQALYELAFRKVHEAAEALKTEGLGPTECWSVLFVAMQDLQAADFGMGSTAHEETLVMQRDRLVEDVQELQRTTH